MGTFDLGPLVGISGLIILALIVMVWYGFKLLTKGDKRFGWVLLSIIAAIVGFIIWRIY